MVTKFYFGEWSGSAHNILFMKTVISFLKVLIQKRQNTFAIDDKFFIRILTANFNPLSWWLTFIFRVTKM